MLRASSLPAGGIQAIKTCTASFLKGLQTLTTINCERGNPTGPPAFVFDIDGVLIRGKVVLPAAVQAVKQLCLQGAWRFPVCFLTNGGGVPEEKKAQQLSNWLGVPVHEQQVILSHTPMRSLAQGRLGQLPVLVSGRGEVMSVAASYGFSKAVHTTQLAAALPGALPFQQPAPLSGAGCPVHELGLGSESQPWAAVLVMTDPAGQHWYQDLQLLTDVITSHGVPTRSHPVPGSHPVELYFSNPDLLWAAEYNRPRFGQGAFSSALDALHRQVTGTPLPNARWFGKPNAEPYRLAEQLLTQQAVQLGLVDPRTLESQLSADETNITQKTAAAAMQRNNNHKHVQADGHNTECAHMSQRQQASTLHAQPAASIFSAIYAVGDNPAADVRGANLAGPPWVSMLVRTGVFAEGHNSSSYPAHVVVTDVLAAVQAALHRTRNSRWHSMR